MMFETNTPLPLIVCQTCRGVGYRRHAHPCRECRGMAVAHLNRTVLYYFDEPLTGYHVVLRRFARAVAAFELVGSIIFALGFFLVFFIDVYTSHDLGVLATEDFWLHGPPIARLCFWLSVIAFSYTVYRAIAGDKQPIHIPWDTSQNAESDDGAPQMPPSVSWKELRRFKRKHRHNIASSYTARAKQSVDRGFRIAVRERHATIEPIHIFLGLLLDDHISSVFLRLGISSATVDAEARRVFQNISVQDSRQEPALSDASIQIFFHAYDIAKKDHMPVVDSTEVLLATVYQSPEVQEILYGVGVDKETLANVVAWVRIRERLHRQYTAFRRASVHVNKYGIDRAMTAVSTPYLNTFSTDITIAAKYGRLTPCVARDKEIEEILRVIDGGRQSVILVGDHGVGKMSIIEGITERMIEGAVPKRLQEKRLVQISASALVAGTTVAGAEERLLRMLREASRAGNVILFINNIHELCGMSSAGGGDGPDISEALAEGLSSEQLVLFATSTVEGYNQHIIQSQLGTAMTRVDVNEMQEGQVIQVLESKVGYTEYKHTVYFSYTALAAAAQFAKRFLHDQRLPESALEIMVEAGSFVRRKRGERQLVTVEDVATIVHERTGIPLTSISAPESKKLLDLEAAMHEEVVGQSEAVSLVANALRRARADIRSAKRPIATFLFLGPTGVGKTELAKTIARVYFGGEDRMIRLDMSEFQDVTAVYRLIGEPGKQGTGLLTEAVRQRPFSLVLLDEMEKADKNILHLFLQVFDDGRLTDSVGRVIDFTNTIIIATSNAGTAYVQEQMKAGVDTTSIRNALIHSELAAYYRPEFLNRFDGIVLFRPLAQSEIKEIARLMMKEVVRDVSNRGIELRIEEAALDALAVIGFDPEFGARPMRRAIQEKVENKLAELILSGEVGRRDTVIVGAGAEVRVEKYSER